MVFDTETIGVDKKFCYNVGYVIVSFDENNNVTILDRKEYMVKQVWYNKMLYSTAYYADKKPIYTKRIREKKIQVLPFEKVIAEIQGDIEIYNINFAYAYNASFDISVFDFNTDWFKTINPLDEINVYDIRAYFMDMVKNNEEFFKFCEENNCLTENENYSTTAETAYKYLKDKSFVEEHTALADSEIEMVILHNCLINGQNIFDAPPKVPKYFKRNKLKELVIEYKEKKYKLPCYGYTVYKKRNTIKVR